MFFSIRGNLFTPGDIAKAMKAAPPAKYRGIDGEPCVRTKDTHPYAYDEFVVWGGFGERGDSAIYSDRLRECDAIKFERLQAKHFPECVTSGWANVSKPALTAFMREFFNDPGMHVERLTQQCNIATGFPIWAAYFSHGTEFKAHVASFVATSRATRIARSAQDTAAKAFRAFAAQNPQQRRSGTSRTTAWRQRCEERALHEQQAELALLYKAAREATNALTDAKAAEAQAANLLHRVQEIVR